MVQKISSLQPILDRHLEHKELKLILIGGCSRSGKSTLAQELNKALPLAQVLSLDSWILSAHDRPPHSRVMERYDHRTACVAIDRLLSGQPAHAPIYDPVTRQSQKDPVQILSAPPDLLIVEGVIALGLENLRKKPHLSIFVEVPDELRLQRLFSFYVNEKKWSFHEAQKLILERENEEVPFVRATAASADFVYLKNEQI